MNAINRRHRKPQRSYSCGVCVEPMEGRVLRSGTLAASEVQPAAARVTDGTSNTVLSGEVLPATPAAETRFFAGFTSRFSAGGVG
jgi:hypothetical protein